MAARMRGMLRWFLEKRYRILARLFEVPVSDEQGGEPAAVIVQVDALGYQHLQTVLDRGYMPNLRAMLRTGEYRLQRWRCGLPSDTPPVQSGIMYGYNQDLVGFYWMDKTTGKRLNCANPSHSRLLEEQITAAGNQGILSHGSAYGSILSGNARRAVGTVSRLGSYHFHSLSGVLGAVLFVLFKPSVLFGTALHYVGDMVKEIADYAVARATGRLRRREHHFPITRAIINVLLREVSTAGAIMDMFSGLPVIYVSYLGYDAVAHHNGPLEPNATRTLTAIDRAIGKFRRAARWSQRPYNLFVLSDHGMNPSIPFRMAFNEPLSTYISSLTGDHVAVDEYDADRYMGQYKFSPLNQDLQEMEQQLPWPVRTMVRRVRILFYGNDSFRALPDANRISVIDCSPMAHVYVHDLPRRLSMTEIESRYPGLIRGLVSHPGVALLMGVEDGKVVAISKEGRTSLGVGGSLTGTDPLLQFDEPEIAAQEIQRLASAPLAGDLILFAAYHGDRLVCFQDQLGAHGTVGGDQSYPFFIHPRHLDISLEGVTTAAEMYPIMRKIAGIGEDRDLAQAGDAERAISV